MSVLISRPSKMVNHTHKNMEVGGYLVWCKTFIQFGFCVSVKAINLKYTHKTCPTEP